MSTARWRLQTCDVPMESVRVFHAGMEGMDVQLGSEVLWVESQSHWEDIAEKVRQCFAALPERRTMPPRNGKLPDWATHINVSGACYSGEDE